MLSLDMIMSLVSGQMPFKNVLNVLPEIDKALHTIAAEQGKLTRFHAVIKTAVAERRDITDNEFQFIRTGSPARQEQWPQSTLAHRNGGNAA